MKKTRKFLFQVSFYDQLAIQEKLEDLARRGWMLKQPGSLFWTFERMEPKQLRFAVTYFPGASEFDPGPTVGELTKMDFCAEDGWQFVAKWGAMQVFCSEDPDAVPIETDPVAQVANVRRTMRKNVLISQGFMVALVVYWLVFQGRQLLRDPVEYLSDSFNLYQLPIWLLLLATSLYEIWMYFSWSRKAVRAAEEDGVFLSLHSRAKVGNLLAVTAWLFVLLAFGASGTSFTFILIWGAVMFTIRLIADTILKCLKKRGAPRWVNMLLSTGSIFLLATLFTGILVAVLVGGGYSFRNQEEHQPVGTYEYHGREMEIYDDPLPLVIEDLMADAKGNWSKEMDLQGTGLVVRAEYDQKPLWTEPKETQQLRYSVIDIKVPFLYDFIKQSILDSRQDIVLEEEDRVFMDHYEPIDPTPWGAQAAYQAWFSRSALNEYLLCWEDRIVEIKFYWEPTQEQIKTAAEILRSF